MPNGIDPENEEIDVTEIVERIEAVEKENSALKEKIISFEAQLAELVESLDALAESIGE